MDNLDGNHIPEEEEEKERLPSNYRETMSVNNSFARSDVSEKEKNFTTAETEIKWQYTNFKGGTQEDNIDCAAPNKWSVNTVVGEDKGINIRSQLVKPNISFSNQVFEVTIKATLHGTSNLWVFTRFKSIDNSLENSRSPVIVINKQECLYQLPWTRVKCMVGSLKSNIDTTFDNSRSAFTDIPEKKKFKGNKFQYIKRQDIWKLWGEEEKLKDTAATDNLAFSDDQVLKDKLDVKFTIRDAGEFGMEIIFYNSSDEVASTMTFFHQDEFDKDGQMLLAGSGNSVYIKDIRIKRRERISYGQEIDSRSYDWWTIF